MRPYALPLLALAALAIAASTGSAEPGADKVPPSNLAGAFQPPANLANDLGSYRSPLLFDDGRPVRTKADWNRRRQELLKYWHGKMGPWPPLLDKPELSLLGSEKREGFEQHKVRVQVASDRRNDGYLLAPEGKGPFPAVLVVYYEPETGVGLGKAMLRDFALQLAKRGFVALSIGSPYTSNDPADGAPVLQPLSYLAYVAANCHTALAQHPKVDPKRIGIVGHSYGGKWAMFASCLYEKFAASAWSDPGIVFDEARGNVNYWEPWYLGFERGVTRKPGIPTAENPRTGPYREMMAEKRDLHELHALMAPRPFLVSGGSEDRAERWKALNHSIAVNRLLGAENRVGMTLRPAHDPTPESNEAIYTLFEWSLKR